MLKEEVIKECYENEHKGFKIVAVDLSQKFNKENDQKRFYCVKCLIEKIGSKKIILFEEALKKAEDAKKELKKNSDLQIQQKLENIQKIKASITTMEENFQNTLIAFQKYLEQQITIVQKQMEEIPEPTNLDDNIKLLSSCYKDDNQFSSPQPNQDTKEMVRLLNSIKSFIEQIKSSQYIHETEKQIKMIESQNYIDQDFEVQQKTPALIILCETHQMEIIMLNLSQAEFVQKNTYLCIDCIQDSIIGANKATSNYLSLKEANKRWKMYLEEQNENKTQRQTKFIQAIGIIKKLQEKYNQEFSKINQSLNDELIKEPKGFEKLLKLKNISFFDQDQQNLNFIMEILGQKEKYKNQEQIQSQEDSKFFQSQKKILEELIKENLIVENQLSWIQNYDQQPQNLNDVSKDNIQTDQEVIDFLKKTSIYEQYFSLFEVSFNYLRKFKQEELDLKYKGKLDKLSQSEQENQSKTIQIYQKWYKQFQDNQLKLERLMNVYEIEKKLIYVEQEKQILLQEEINKNKILNQEDHINDQRQSIYQSKNQKKHLDSALINKHQFDNSLIQMTWQEGETKLLQFEFGQKLYKFIEEKTKKKIKNKYLIYSETEAGLNYKTFWSYIDKMSNLLMIFKSKSQYIFGGFSSCQWLKQNKQYQVDETLSSFLFSQSYDQIYPIISSYYAIINYDSGIGFGCEDLRISQDFQNGSSLLGGTNQKHHLFGQATPNILECEILMFTFT
ncbi:unnamed protein product [Paramecium sonneborni]|uniref:TLDc domain-containing protein n=1 Tax=Paramecium sonneborni TaxID=65129 RepID=A0A8S1QR70_9CILI|nr:unnamed protein product [Paramecium sonneborni]